MKTVKFCVGTSAEYAALKKKNPETLYFTEDTSLVYKGNKRLGGPIVKLVSTLPSKGEEPGIIYINSGNGITKYWDGKAFYKIGLI